jgi:hypothetical protein
MKAVLVRFGKQGITPVIHQANGKNRSGVSDPIANIKHHSFAKIAQGVYCGPARGLAAPNDVFKGPAFDDRYNAKVKIGFPGIGLKRSIGIVF